MLWLTADLDFERCFFEASRRGVRGHFVSALEQRQTFPRHPKKKVIRSLSPTCNKHHPPLLLSSLD
jgi:hypothetical protein